MSVDDDYCFDESVSATDYSWDMTAMKVYCDVVWDWKSGLAILGMIPGRCYEAALMESVLEVELCEIVMDTRCAVRSWNEDFKSKNLSPPSRSSLCRYKYRKAEPLYTRLRIRLC